MNKYLSAAFGVIALVGGLSSVTTASFAARNYNVPTPALSASMPWAVSAFCKHNAAECRGGGASVVAANAQLITLLRRVNGRVNGAISYRAEPLDDWSINPRFGDCEDYALSKRSALIKMGLPGSALRIGITKTRRGEPHAVLVVMTDSGKLILDNRSGAVRELNQTEYRLQATSGRSLTTWVAG